MAALSLTEALTGKAWEGPAIALLDLDAFFASVEELDHPEWKGKPICVGGSPKSRGVVSTANYEARKFGIHSAMPSSQAAKLCPDAIWVKPRFSRYHELSDQVMDLIFEETPYMQQMSVDEAYFDLTPGRFSKEDPVQIVKRIQERVSELGISCSIGLASNKTVAKIASEKQKPRGLTIVFPGTEERFLAALPIRALPGIGPATAKILSAQNYKSLGDLAHANLNELQKVLPNQAESLILRAQGKGSSKISHRYEKDETKSVSVERSFVKDLEDKQSILKAIAHMSELVASRLRRQKLKANCVTLKIKSEEFGLKNAQEHLKSETDEDFLIQKTAQELLDKIFREGQHIRLVGVGLSDFKQKGTTMELFSDQSSELQAKQEKLKKLNQTKDLLRDRFGSDILRYGRDFELDEFNRELD